MVDRSALRALTSLSQVSAACATVGDWLGRDVGTLAHADPDRVLVGLSILFALERLLDTDAPPIGVSNDPGFLDFALGGGPLALAD